MGPVADTDFRNPSYSSVSTIITQDMILHTVFHILIFRKVVPIVSTLMTQCPNYDGFQSVYFRDQQSLFRPPFRAFLLPRENVRKHKQIFVLCSSAVHLLQYTCITTVQKQQPEEQRSGGCCLYHPSPAQDLIREWFLSASLNEFNNMGKKKQPCWLFRGITKLTKDAILFLSNLVGTIISFAFDSQTQ